MPAHVDATIRPTSSEASRSTATFLANSGTCSPQPFHASATRAARRTTASACPPTQTGGPPGVIGGGRSGPSISATNSPPGHDSPRNSTRRAPIVSSRCTRRSFTPRLPNPNASCSGRSIGSPVPIPRTNRPPLMSSRETAILARSPAGRSAARVTSVPSVRCGYRAAIDDSVAKASSDGRSGGAPGGKKWSKANTPSKPSSSALLATVLTFTGSPENSGRTIPIFIAPRDRARRRRSPRRRCRARPRGAAPPGGALALRSPPPSRGGLARAAAPRPPRRRRRRPPPPVTAPTQRAAGLHDYVPDLRREPVGSAGQAALGDDPAADPGAHRDYESVRPGASRTEPVLPPPRPAP